MSTKTSIHYNHNKPCRWRFPIWKLQFPYWETPVSNWEIAVSCLGTGVLTVRCITLLFKDSFLSAHKVLQILLSATICNGICNDVTNILLIHYLDFVADGRCFSLFILYVKDYVAGKTCGNELVLTKIYSQELLFLLVINKSIY